jgi:diaminopimelate epimerase
MLCFSKWEGLGNDFVLVSALDGRPARPEALARELCDRHRGVGGDGLILLERAPDGGLAMTVYNSDGSPARMCGNGLRCLAAFVHREGLAGPEVTFHTPSGPRRARILRQSPWQVEIDLGVPQVHPLPGVGVSGQGFWPIEVAVGNPHRVVFVDSVGEVPLERWGPALESHEAYIERANVEFVEVRSPRHLAVRVWERGAGATQACGTGAAAALVAAAFSGRAARQARVDLPGGTLEVEWPAEGPVRLRGPCREIFRGVFQPDPEEESP